MILAIGMESVGKTQLLSRLCRRYATPDNFRGSTLACESYFGAGIHWIDAPGLCRDSETETAKATLSALSESDKVLLVVRADQAEEQLESIMPMLVGRERFLVLTFADRLPSKIDLSEMERQFQEALGVAVFSVDARRIDGSIRAAVMEAATTQCDGRFRQCGDLSRLLARYRSENLSPTLLERVIANPLVAALLLLIPAAIAVSLANRVADSLYDPLMGWITPLHDWLGHAPAFVSALLVGEYGLVSMFPFLLLYALPTILVFSVILAVYKSTGLIDRLSVALHPWLRSFGIGGRDLVRVVMGFGCNVPAIVASRSCASCSRCACVSAISFGSACSYQLPATLAVFAAAGMSGLGVIYIGVLAVTTLIYLRFTTPRVLRLAGNRLLLPDTDPLQVPSLRGIIRGVLGDIRQFLILAFPIFAVICFAAATLAYCGVLDAFARFLAPLMSLFQLPGDAATAIALGSVRKDGIAIGLLDDDWGTLKVGLESPAQVLTAVYLAGVLLPCLVTLNTIGREMGWRYAARLCSRQVAWASVFGLIIAWLGPIIC